MTREMADSTNPFDIPVNRFPIVAGYVDGLYAWPTAGWVLHSGSLHVRIAVFSTTNDGMVLDIESGNATPEEVPGWVAARLAAGQYPSVYVNRSNVGAVLAALHDAGLDGQFGVWIATLDCVHESFPGTYAVQWASSACSGGHYDLSDVADYWPGLDPLPPQPAHSDAAGAVTGWDGLVNAVDEVLPAFGGGLGVLSSELLSLG